LLAATARTGRAQEPAKHHRIAIVIPADPLERVSDTGRRFYQTILAELRRPSRRLPDGKLHALVNNAAISPKTGSGGRLGTFNTDLALWQQVFNISFFATLALAQPAGKMQGISSIFGSATRQKSSKKGA